MRILLTARPLTGHVEPLRPLAEAAIRRGHEVAFATGEPVVSALRDRGLRAFAAGRGLRDPRGVRPPRPRDRRPGAGGAPGGVFRGAVHRHRARAAVGRPDRRDRRVAARRGAAGGGGAGRADRGHAGRHPVRHGRLRRALRRPRPRARGGDGGAALARARAGAAAVRRAVPASLRRSVPAVAPAAGGVGDRAAARPSDAGRPTARRGAGMADRDAARSRRSTSASAPSGTAGSTLPGRARRRRRTSP